MAEDTIPQLITFIQGKFRANDFETVKQILIQREEKTKHELFNQVEKNKKSEDEIKNYKREIEELNESNLRLEEEKTLKEKENEIMCERERRGKEKCDKLKEELRKLEERVKEKENEIRVSENAKKTAESKLEVWKSNIERKGGEECEKLRKKEARVKELEIEIGVLESGKKKVEGELEVSKKRYKDLELRVVRLERDMVMLVSVARNMVNVEEREKSGCENGERVEREGSEGSNGNACIREAGNSKADGSVAAVSERRSSKDCNCKNEEVATEFEVNEPNHGKQIADAEARGFVEHSRVEKVGHLKTDAERDGGSNRDRKCIKDEVASGDGNCNLDIDEVEVNKLNCGKEIAGGFGEQSRIEEDGDLTTGDVTGDKVKHPQSKMTQNIINILSGSDDEILPSPKRKRVHRTGENDDNLLGFLDTLDSTSDSEDVMDEDEDIETYIKRRLCTWDVEEDIILDLKKDSELGMRAVCALYNKQVFGKGPINSDATRGIALGKFLTNGDPQGKMRKSIKELQAHDQQGIDDCRRIAISYSRQLFDIYKKTPDPFFSTN